MNKNILTVLSLVSVLSLGLSANAAIDMKSALKTGANASLNSIKAQSGVTTTTTNVNTQLVNSYRKQINAVVTKSNNMSKSFNNSVNGISSLLLSSNEIAKVRGNVPANSAEATDRLALYLLSDRQSKTVSNRINSLSANKKSQLNYYVKTMKNSTVGYTSLAKEATTLSANIAKTPSVAVALSPELKSLKQVSTNATKQARTATNLSRALIVK